MIMRTVLTVVALSIMRADGPAPPTAVIELWHMQIIADDPGLFVRGVCRFKLKTNQRHVRLRFPKPVRELEVTAPESVRIDIAGRFATLTDVPAGEYETEFAFFLPWRRMQTPVVIRQDYPIEHIVVTLAPTDPDSFGLGLQEVPFATELQTFISKSLPPGLKTAVLVASPALPLPTVICRGVVLCSALILAVFVGMAWGCKTKRPCHRS